MPVLQNVSAQIQKVRVSGAHACSHILMMPGECLHAQMFFQQWLHPSQVNNLSL